jgi:hypothetical protein
MEASSWLDESVLGPTPLQSVDQGDEELLAIVYAASI